MSAAVVNALTQVLALVRDEKEPLAAIARSLVGGVMDADPKPSAGFEDRLRAALVDLEIATREDLLHRLFPEAAAPAGATMDPMRPEALRCRCGVCLPCWERELVAAAREGRAPARPEATL